MALDIYEEIDLQDCPYCGGAGVLEEERGWLWYVACADCGCETAPIRFQTLEERLEAARTAANLWNMGKVVRYNAGD